MKKVITIFALALCILNSYADYTTPNTNVSWNLNDLVANSGGVVTFSGGNYFVNSNLTIASSDTLKMLSNATVKLALNVVFLVNGSITINPADSVKFTSIDTTQKFTELRLDGASNTSSFNKFIYEYSFNGLRLLNVSPVFTNCTFRYNCNGASLTVPALNLFNANPVITNCLFYRNYRAAIAGGSNIANAPQILNSQFIENVLTSGNVPQINLGQSGAGTTIIRGNTIRGISILSGGIAALPTSGTFTVIIENNIIKKNRYGIALNGSVNAIIRGNTIDSNNIQGVPLQGGSGLNFVGSGINAKVSKNIIRWNLWGVTLQSSAAPVFGDLSISDTNYIGMNYIFFNSNSGLYYDFYNNTNQPIKAENNFWGTGNLDSIEAHIFHQVDSAALGFVDYLPIFIPVGIQPVISEQPSEFKLFDAYPNPFNPAAKIKFQTPLNLSEGGSLVNLSIYDISGKLIKVLVNQILQAGTFEIDFSGENIASGIYFYKLTSGSFTASKRMVLIK